MVTNKIDIKRIAIQGAYGAFHEIAARHYHQGEQVEIIPIISFDELIQTAEAETESEGALMAIENSIAGSILYNYKLLRDSRLSIAGEIFLRIRHNLMALPGQSIPEIKEVHSHPMALAQCRVFLKQYPHIRLVESEDTALSAKKIQEGKLTGIAAIASARAAELYQLEILTDGIETNKKNFTRFLELSRKEGPLQETLHEKFSVCFSLHHHPGSLADVLNLLASKGANLTKIQSVPIIGKEWQYTFFVDFILKDAAQRRKLLTQLDTQTTAFQLLGNYKKGNYHDS